MLTNIIKVCISLSIITYGLNASNQGCTSCGNGIIESNTGFSVNTQSIGALTDQVNNYWGSGDTQVVEKNGKWYIFDTGGGLLHENQVDPRTGYTISVGNIIDQVNNYWGDQFDIFTYHNQSYIIDIGGGLAHLNKIDPSTGNTISVGNLINKINYAWGADDVQVFQYHEEVYIMNMGAGIVTLHKLNPETGNTVAVGTLVDRVNNLWGIKFDVFEENNQWYIVDVGGGLAHLNKFDPRTAQTIAVGELTDQVNNLWGSEDIQVVKCNGALTILDTAGGLLHANQLNPETGETVAGSNVVDQVNNLWGSEFDVFVAHNKMYVFDVGGGLGHLNALGLKVNLHEQCDDGNTIDGDGCSSTCQIELHHLAITSIDGNSANTVHTNNTRPEINGTCEANTLVTVKIDGTAIAPTTMCSANGTFSMTPNTAIATGQHNVTATQIVDGQTLVSPTDILVIESSPKSAPTVTITEDTNNDGKITSDELNGNVDVLITMPTGTNVGDTLKITNPDGSIDSVTVTQDMIDNGYPKSYTPPANGEKITVKATLTDTAGDTSPEGKDEATMDTGTGPDYEVAMEINKTTFSKPAKFFVRIRVSELNGGINNGDVVYSVTKNDLMTLNFDATLTSDPDGNTLNNQDWQWADAGLSYYLTYIGTSRKFPKNERKYVGISGTLTPPTVANNGSFLFIVKLRSGTGDTNTNNNETSSKISYSS